MKTPYFELNKDKDFDSVARSIIDNKTALHFVRRRNILPENGIISTLLDNDARGLFEEGRERNLKTFNNPAKSMYKWLIVPAAFLMLLSVIIYHAVAGTFAKSDYDVGIMVLTFGLCFITFGISLYSLIIYIRNFRFLKKSFFKMDDLYVIYDSKGIPCSICVRGKSIKVLYKNTIYTIKNNKIKGVTQDNAVYRAYLNMLPWAVLDFDKFYPNERHRITNGENFIPVQTYTYLLKDKYCLGLNNTVFHSNFRKTHAAVNKPLQFTKYLFEFDENLQLQTLYSAANESFRFGLEYITKASIKEIGNTAVQELKELIGKKRALGILWDDYIKISL